MKNIVMTRIDDRLIHGQVMTAWLGYHQANEILIIDNDLADDDFTVMMIKSLVPKEIKLNVLNEKDASSYLLSPVGKEKIIILVKRPQVIEDEITNGVSISDLNVGGMGMTTGRKKIFKNITASNEEVACFRRLINLDVHVFVQVVPQDKAVALSNYI